MIRSLFVLVNFLMSFTIFGNVNISEYSVGVEALPFLPYSDIQDGEYVGLIRNIMDSFAKKENIKFIYKPLPISRLYSDFYNGKLDFKIPANPIWQKQLKEKRKVNIHYSEPVIDFIDGVLVREKGIKLKKLGSVTGFTLIEDYQKKISAKEIIFTSNSSLIGLLQQGLLGRIDGLYLNIAVGRYYLKNQLKKEDSLVFDESLPFDKGSYHLASIKHNQLIEKFNKFLRSNDKVLKDVRNEIDFVIK